MADNSIKNPIQLKFFEKLKQSVSQNISVANEIADVLEISQDGAYRRMRGESILSMDEMIKLCKYFKISPDVSTIEDETSATFHFQRMIHDENGYEEYLKNILSDLQKIDYSNPKHIIYAAGDLPIFIQFISPEYSAFKAFFWQKAMLNIPSMDGKKYSNNNIKPEISELCKKISDTYIRIPSTEIWHFDTIHSNIKLIEFAWESGMFATIEDAIIICNNLSEILILVEKQAEKSSKFSNEERWTLNEGNFTLYQSDFVLTNNHIFVSAGNTKTLYLTHNTFNSILTTNTVFCNETEEWLKNLIRKSTQISGVGEKQRHKFFKNAQERIESLVMKIKE